MANSKTYKIIIPILFLLLPLLLFSQTRKIYLSRQYPVLRVENQVWMGLPQGLFQYRPDDDTFKKYSIPNLPPAAPIRNLYYNDEWLWCVPDSGLAAFHTRLNEWYFFDTSNGLPSNRVNGMAFREDYVWVATDRGAARFDLLIEEWEIYDRRRGLTFSRVTDITAWGDYVWMAGTDSLAEYDPRFEKWRYYPVSDGSPLSIRRMFQLGDEIWLVCDRGLVRFRPALQTRQYFFQPALQEENLLDIVLENDRIWAFTRKGLFTFSFASGVWKDFEGNGFLQNITITDGYIEGDNIWIVTPDRVLLWKRQLRTWEFLDYTYGLSTTGYRAVYAEGGLALLFHPSLIDYRSSEQAPWRSFLLPATRGTGISGRRLFKNLFDNESGGFIPLGKYRWSWEGTRAVFLQERRFSLLPQEPSQGFSGNRLDIKSRVRLSPGRSISAFYNNADYSEVMYGVRYRSRTSDVLQEFNWGDFRREAGSNPFGESADIFGSRIWLQAGAKTPRFKRSLVTVKAHTGELRSRKTYEHRQGARQNFDLQIRDTDYTRSQFFHLPHTDSTTAPPEELEIFVDDLNPLTNTSNTLISYSLAGVSGDFDRWIPTEDFYFYPRLNAVRFLTTITPGWTVVARYTLGGIRYEEILQQGETVSTAPENIYYLGGQGILPVSFSLEITDSGGTVVPLSRFGIDRDGDGRVDSRFVDFDNGFLFFPAAQPFPAAVYDPMNPQSFYRLHLRYQTALSLIRLAHTNLVRGSETVRLDGRPVTGGNDYVIDYTNGTLIFVREGLVTSDTRIEIEYEYYLENRELITSAGVNMSPSDNFYLQADWLNFTPPPADGSAEDEPTNLLNLHGELRQRVGAVDVRLLPALAYQPEQNRLTGISAEGLISTSRFRLQSLFRHYETDYRNLYRAQSVIGTVERQLQFFASADLLSSLRLTGQWQHLQGTSTSAGNSPTDRMSDVSLLFHHRNWLAWQMSYSHFRTRLSGTDTGKSFLQSRLEYQLPDAWKRWLPLNGLKLETWLRSGKENTGTPGVNDDRRFQQAFVRLNSFFSQRFQMGFFYRIDDVKNVNREGIERPASRAERVLLDLSHEEWQLLQLNLRMENHLNQYFHWQPEFRTVNLRQFSQANIRFFPGHLWRRLSPFSFDLNFTRSLTGGGDLRQHGNHWLWWVGNDMRDLPNYLQMENYFLKNEFRPSPYWYVYSLIEHSTTRTGMGSSEADNRFWNWVEKIDLRLGAKTRFFLQHKYFYRDVGFHRTDHYSEPSSQLEYRWTPDFLQIFYLRYRRRWWQDQSIHQVSHRWEGRYDFIWRKTRFYGLRRLEWRQSFTGSYLASGGTEDSENLRWSVSSSLDVYPVHSLIIRLRADWNAYDDFLLPGNAARSLLLSLKLSLRL